MLKRHIDQVECRLDELQTSGTTFIAWGELYHWYNVERINKTPWRDLKTRWDELLEERKEEPADPHVAQVRDGISLFFARNVQNLGDLIQQVDGWFGIEGLASNFDVSDALPPAFYIRAIHAPIGVWIEYAVCEEAQRRPAGALGRSRIYGID